MLKMGKRFSPQTNDATLCSTANEHLPVFIRCPPPFVNSFYNAKTKSISTHFIVDDNPAFSPFTQKTFYYDPWSGSCQGSHITVDLQQAHTSNSIDRHENHKTWADVPSFTPNIYRNPANSGIYLTFLISQINIWSFSQHVYGMMQHFKRQQQTDQNRK